MKSIYTIFILFFTLPLCVSGQERSNVWLFGSSAAPPKVIVDFASGSPVVDTTISFQAELHKTFSSICDSSGSLLFYTNGVNIYDSSHNIMQGSNGLNPGLYTTNYSVIGLPHFQGSLILPWPDSSHKYFLFHQSRDYEVRNIRPSRLLYSVIDMHLNSGKGAVIQKNEIAIQDTLETAMLTSCKHANGRDWWLLVPTYLSDKYYQLLITPQGIYQNQVISLQDTIFPYDGQASFSPNGKLYAVFDNWNRLRVWDFDRCSGFFSNLRILQTDDFLAGIGLSFSPNSKLIYACSSRNLYQFDLTLPNIQSTKFLVAQFDSISSPAPYEALFGNMILGPDSRIYMNSILTIDKLHVIENPDSLGIACNFQPRSVELHGLNIATLPNLINYDLEADTNSICDSLTTGISLPKADLTINIFPNPNNGAFQISYTPTPENLKLQVFNILGEEVYTQRLPKWSQLQNIDISNFETGIYFVKLSNTASSTSLKFLIE